MMQHRIKQYVDQYRDMLCIELDSESETHLFRHASEITRETKGGYLKGKIIVPKSTKPFYLRLSLVPAEPDLQHNSFHLHPNLLHINLRQNKKNRNLEMGELPHDVDWSFVFRIDPDGNVSRVSSTSQEKRFHQMQPVPDNSMYNSENNENKGPRVPTSGIYEQNLTTGPLNVPEYSNLSLTRVTVVKEGRYLDLGTSGLMLNIITPLQKFSKGGTTITDVLQQRYQDLQHRPMTTSLMKKIEESFTSKKTKVKLQRVRLMAEMFGCDHGMTFQKSTLSQIIMNSKSKECGPLRLHDVNPAASCHRSRTKIFILSFFKLVSEVKAAFILWDLENGVSINDPILEVLNQPEDCTVFNQTVVVCTAPAQDWNVIQAIKRKNFELRICAYRPSDNRMSMNSFKFEYLPHVPSEDGPNSFHGPSGFVCGTCHLEQYNTVKEELPLAKPGWQRRKHDEKKEIPDHLKIKKPMPPLCEISGKSSSVPLILGTETMPICVGGDSDHETISIESNEVMDLSVAQSIQDHPNDKYLTLTSDNANEKYLSLTVPKYLSRPRPEIDPSIMTPPKKRRFDNHQIICDSHPIAVTLPPR